MKAAQLFFSTALVALLSAGAQAGVVTGVTSVTVGDNPFFASSGGTGNVVTFDPNQQVAVLEKTFTTLGDVPIIIDRTSSQGVDTFHVDERVRNDTGVDWTDFHFVVELIDANQNGPGKTTASVYSVRPRAGAPVSTPLMWDEVREGLDPSGFVFAEVRARVARHGDLFAPVLTLRQSLGAALRSLG